MLLCAAVLERRILDFTCGSSELQYWLQYEINIRKDLNKLGRRYRVQVRHFLYNTNGIPHNIHGVATKFPERSPPPPT
jgi:hypothetical protein